MDKIGGWKKFRDFLTNHLKWYIPPPNDFTAEFGLQLLQKKKKVFKTDEVKFVEGVPQESEFNIRTIVEMINEDGIVIDYLPNYSKKHRPDKTYVLNIINTVHPNSVVNWVKELKKEKLTEKQKEKNDVLIIDKEIMVQFE